MRKIAIVLAAAAGISAVAGTGYVYTTDTCLTDSCRAEKERRRQAKIEHEWRLIADNIGRKSTLVSVMKDDITPLINTHFQTIHRRIERSLIVNSKCAPGGWTNMATVDGYDLCSEYDRTEQNQNERNRRSVLSAIDSIEKKADVLNGRLALFRPDVTAVEERIFLSENSEFDREFSKYLNSLNGIVEGDVIQGHSRTFAELQVSITNSLTKINSLKSSPSP